MNHYKADPRNSEMPKSAEAAIDQIRSDEDDNTVITDLDSINKLVRFFVLVLVGFTGTLCFLLVTSGQVAYRYVLGVEKSDFTAQNIVLSIDCLLNGICVILLFGFGKSVYYKCCVLCDDCMKNWFISKIFTKEEKQASSPAADGDLSPKEFKRRLSISVQDEQRRDSIKRESFAKTDSFKNRHSVKKGISNESQNIPEHEEPIQEVPELHEKDTEENHEVEVESPDSDKKQMI